MLADLTRRARRKRWDGRVQEYDARWVLHHLVEHFAGHSGQILMLRHLDRVRRRAAGAPARRAARRASATTARRSRRR